MRPHAASRWASEELGTLEAAGLLRQLEPLSSPQGAVVSVAGERLVNFSSNDYLGLAGDPLLAEEAGRGLGKFGVGAGASRLLVGDSLAHHALEKALAELCSSSAALVFGSGFAANTGIVPALCGEEDVVFSDERNHASLVDACRLSRARTVVYPHADVAALEALMSRFLARRMLVVTDAVFSMDGDLAPLGELVRLCREKGAALLVDEAHATGVFGPTGAGLSEAMGVGAEVDVRVGTLGKALGVFGAWAASSREVVSLLVNRARPLVFSTGLPPALCHAALASLQRMKDEPSLRERLWRNVRLVAEGLSRLGIPAQPRSPIFPVVLGTPARALEVARGLRAQGLLVKAIRPPTVPEGSCRLRVAVSAAHTDEHLEKLLLALSRLGVGRAGQ